MLYRSEGIVIRAMDYGETHKIVTLLTNNAGKAGVLIRGAKKVRSKHASLAQPFTYGEYTFVRNSGLGTLQHGEIINSNHLLRSDLDASAHAAYLAELTDKGIQDEEAGAIHFNQLKACFDAMSQGKDYIVVTQLYEMKMLELTGYSPVVEECIHCGNHVSPFYMSFYAGGVLCTKCVRHDQSHPLISDSALKLLRFYKKIDLQRIGNINISDSTKVELTYLIRTLVDTQLGLKLKTRAFLDNLGKLV